MSAQPEAVSRNRRSLVRRIVGSGRRRGPKIVALVATTVMAGALAIVPATPALASQNIYFTSSPASTVYVGQSITYSFYGLYSYVFGPYITGCFANYSDGGGNWSYNFGGDYSSGNCYVNSRGMNAIGTVSVQIGFYLSNGGSITDGASVQVLPVPPSIQTFSGSQTVTSGSTATFSSYATGNPFPSEQWQLSTNSGASFNYIPGATANTYQTPPTTVADNGNQYRAVYTNTGGSATSNVATLTVNPRGPVITTEPVAASTGTGTAVTFTAHANADPSATVQWLVSSDSGATFAPVTGASTSDTLSVTPTYADNGNLYEAQFSNGGGSATSNAAQLTVVPFLPQVTADPQAAHVTSGTPVTLTASAAGDPLPAIQWQVSTNGGTSFTSIVGATASDGDYTFTPSFTDDGNSYRAIFSNVAGSTPTAGAALTVDALAPAVAGQTGSVTRTAGGTATFSVTPTGDPAPTSQWGVSTDGGSTFTDISGATGYDLNVVVAYADNGNLYRNTLTNVGGTSVSTPIPLTVGASTPVVHDQPVDQTVVAGGAATFSSSADGDPAATVQWQVSTDGGVSFADIDGQTGSTLALHPAYARDGNQYRAEFTNAGGTTYSNAGLLTVSAAGPVVTLNPVDTAALSGASATLSASATGDPSPTVQWQVSTDLGTTFTDISGATSADYTFTPTQGEDQSLYQAVFTNAGGTTVTTPATLTVTTSLVITAQPSPATVAEGSTATFTAAATGSPTATMQWQVSTDNGTVFTDLPGATTGTFAFATTLGEDQDVYRAVFSNSTGSLSTNGAGLTVTPLPVAPAAPRHKHKPVAYVAPTIQLDAGTVMTGSTSRVTGRTKPRAWVDVFGYTEPSTTYHELARVRADSTGLFTCTIRLHGDSRLYVHVAGLRRSRTIVQDVRSTLSLTASKAGSYRYVFTGTVSPYRSNQLVTLYYNIPGGQLVLATARTDRHGRYRIDRSLLAYGQHYYSVFAVVGSGPVTLGNLSVDRSIAVYRGQ